MSKLRDLRDKCDGLAAEIKRMGEKAKDQSQDWTTEDDVAWQNVNSQHDDARAEVAKEEQRELVATKASEIEARELEARKELRKIGRDEFNQRAIEHGQITNETRGLALRAWFSADKRALQSDELDACQRLGLNPHAQFFDFDLCTTEQVNEGRARFFSSPESRALSAHIGTSGAFTIPDGFVNSLETALLAYGGMRATSEVIRTDSGNTIPYPTANDTSNTGEIIAESAAVSSADPSFGAVNIFAHKYSSKMVRVPAELLEDSAFNIPVILGSMLGERIGRITNTHFTTGDGAAKPRGITTMSTLGKTAASATAITMDELLDLVYSVDEAYIPGAAFMLKRSTTGLLRKLKDGQGRPLWNEEPGYLHTYPYFENTDMPAATTGLKSVLFGQLNKYKIREVRSIRLKRLVERYAEYDQEGFVAFARYDGVLVDAGTNPVKHLIQA